MYGVDVEEVSIRRARQSDARLMETWRRMPEVRRYQPLWPVPEKMLRRGLRGEAGASFEQERGNRLTWIIEADGNAAGWARIRNVDWISKSCSLGFTLAPWAEGKGVAMRGVALVLDLAFGPGRMQRIEADCDVDNTRSQALLERLGFQREGRLRAFAKMPEGRRDFYLYSLLADEWKGSAEVVHQ